MPGERSRLLRSDQEFPASYSDVPKTASYTMRARDTLLKADGGTGTIVITLPSVAASAGSFYVIKYVGVAGTATVIDQTDAITAVSLLLNSNTDVAILFSDGEDWYLMFSRGI